VCVSNIALFFRGLLLVFVCIISGLLLDFPL